MPPKLLPLIALVWAAFFLGSCSLLDSTKELLNVLSVKFLEGSPAVDGQTMVYSGRLVETPSLHKFDLIDGTSIKGSGKSDLDLSSGERKCRQHLPASPMTAVSPSSIRRIARIAEAFMNSG